MGGSGTPRSRLAGAVAACAIGALTPLAGCANPDAPSGGQGAADRVQSAGEPPAPAPRSASGEAARDVQLSPQRALEAFAARYVNWDSHTLAQDQRALAAMAVGQARLAERQALAATGSDSTLARAHVFNRGTVVAVAPDSQRPGWWVVITREQTGGSQEYEGLAPAYHVTLAQLARVRGGFAVERWSPQQ